MKKALSLIIALVFVISSVVTLVSCGGDDAKSGKYNGVYFYESADYGFLINGEDASALLGGDDEEDGFEDLSITIEKNKITFSDGEKDDDMEMTYFVKNGRLVLSEKDAAELFGDVVGELGDDGKIDLYLELDGDILTLYMSLTRESVKDKIELSIDAKFKRTLNQ